MKPQRLRIRGTWWTLKPEKPPTPKVLGLCMYAEREIYFKPNKADSPDTLVHEVLHACFPDLEEEAIVGGEEAVMGALRKFGFIP
jgi:hypothetical protein